MQNSLMGLNSQIGKHYTYHDFLPLSMKTSEGKQDREGRKASKRFTMRVLSLWHLGLCHAGDRLRNHAEHGSGLSHQRAGKLGVFIHQLTFLHVKVAPKQLISQYFPPATQ